MSAIVRSGHQDEQVPAASVVPRLGASLTFVPVPADAGLPALPVANGHSHHGGCPDCDGD